MDEQQPTSPEEKRVTSLSLLPLFVTYMHHTVSSVAVPVLAALSCLLVIKPLNERVSGAADAAVTCRSLQVSKTIT